MYCNYSKDKFGNELTFIIPSWVELPSGKYDLDWVDTRFEWTCNYQSLDIHRTSVERLLKILSAIESEYIALCEDEEWTPQQARQVLPNALKTEICVCGFEEDWKHFFDLRCAKNAHPDMQVLANQLREQFIENKYI